MVPLASIEAVGVCASVQSVSPPQASGSRGARDTEVEILRTEDGRVVIVHAAPKRGWREKPAVRARS
jgi:hypothetical protein